MGYGWSSITCTCNLCLDWIMSKKKNLFFIGITIGLYCVNQVIKLHINVGWLKWFMCCYFNDMIGGITFVAYCNIVFDFYKKKMIRLWQIELLMFFSGIFWEYITPLFRKDTVSDIFDICAYMVGGFIYWILIWKERNGCQKEH